MSPTQHTSERLIVIVTGASSGIGEATARELATRGHHVVLTARRAGHISRIAEEIIADGGLAEAHPVDVTDLERMRGLVQTVTLNHGHVDVLVNNAGVMPLSPLIEGRVHEWNQMIDVNLRGILHGVAAVLPQMEARGSGHIVNIASTAAHRVDPTAAVYCATKFAVRALSEGLRQESENVRVTVISPGYTESELTRHGENEAVREAVDSASREYAIPASAIANAIGYAIEQPRDVDVNEIIVRPTRQR